ncbi:hypothetical protein ABPG77_009062 [Micractinium sp. CCAP 211/92]
MKAALLGLMWLGVAAAAMPAESKEGNLLGSKRFFLLGRERCLRRGYLAAHKCGSRTDLSLYSGGPDLWTTWLVQQAPRPAVQPQASGQSIDKAVIPLSRRAALASALPW